MAKHIGVLAAFVCLCVAQAPAWGQGTTKKTSPTTAPTKDTKDGVVLDVNGKLSHEDKAAPGKPGCAHKPHVVTLTAGTAYVMDLIGTRTGTNLDVYLILQDSTGSILRQDDDSGGNLNSRIIFTPTKTDAYTLLATTLGAGQYGNYRLVVRELAPGEVPPVTGTPAPPVVIAAPVHFGDIVITPVPVPSSSMGRTSNEEGHGYIEMRFLVENLSASNAHRVTLTIPRWRGSRQGYYLQANRRTVEVGPRSSVPMVLWHPDVPGGNGDAEVTIDGQVRDESVSVTLQDNRGGRMTTWWGFGHKRVEDPISHVLAPSELARELERSVFKSAVDAPPRHASSTHAGAHNGKPYTYALLEHFHSAAEPVTSWSRHWLSFTSYDGVALSAEHLRSAPAEVQSALWQYVEAGGTLLVVGPTLLPDAWQRSRVERPGEGLTAYYPGFGQCLVTTLPSVSSWEPEQWRPIVAMWTDSNRSWAQIQTPTEANRSLPVVDDIGIPVRGLFGLMFLFSIFIGPVNLYVLGRLRRKIWLLWTVPTFSFVTCAAVFAFMLVSEGWQGHIRTEGITFLDETTQRASSLSWLGVYSPLTPGDGLHFSYDTEVTPHLRADSGSFRSSSHPLSIDWSADQHLPSGWVAARVPAHFLTRTGTRRLERLLVRPQQDGTVNVVNGLKAPLVKLWFADAEGKVHEGADLGPGAESTLKPTALKAGGEPDSLHQLYRDNWLIGLKRCENSPEAFLTPGSYLALVDGAPFLEEGLRHAIPRQVRSVVVGITKGPGDAR